MPVNESICYMMKPGGVPIKIPLSIAVNPQVTALLGGSPLIGSNDAFTAELVWTDNANKLAANSNIKRLIPISVGSDGSLIVIQGTAKGNAVVAVRNSRTQQIVWSWHIWVTDYDLNDITVSAADGAYNVPGGKVYRYSNSAYNNIWMDRDLGAGVGTWNGTRDIYGLNYQWGRKDPFPGPAATSGSAIRTIYDASAATTISVSTGSTYLRSSIENPKTFYNSPPDWLNSSNDNLWNRAQSVNGSSKTIFDPCPEGWRVPSFSLATTTPFTGLSTPAANSQYYYFNQLGSWAHGGRLTGTSYTVTGSAGHWWSAIASTYSRSPCLQSGTKNSSGVHEFFIGPVNRQYGNYVRCIKDDPNP
jgi:hypothetical protein